MSTSSQTTTSPLRKTVIVPCSPTEAFALFTDQMAAWWPLPTHSVGLETARTVRIEPEVGGRLVESFGEGRTAIWGTVVDWTPPARLSFTWHPGRPVEEATHVEVRFTEVGDGTEVELVHSGWDRRADGVEARAGYDTGWQLILRRFADATTGDGRSSRGRP